MRHQITINDSTLDNFTYSRTSLVFIESWLNRMFHRSQFTYVISKPKETSDMWFVRYDVIQTVFSRQFDNFLTANPGSDNGVWPVLCHGIV